MKSIEITYDNMAKGLKSQFRPVNSPVIVSDLPADFEVIRVIDGPAGWVSDPLAYRQVFRVVGCSMEWPEVPEGAYAPSFTPTYTVHVDAAVAARYHEE